MTKDELMVMVYENRKSMPNWFKAKDIADYIIDVEFDELVCHEQHREFVRILKSLAIHNVPITLNVIDTIESIANKKAQINI